VITRGDDRGTHTWSVCYHGAPGAAVGVLGKVKREILKQLIKAAAEGVLLLSAREHVRSFLAMNFSGHHLKANTRSRNYVMFSLLRRTELPCLNNPRFNTNYPRFVEPLVAEKSFHPLHNL